MRIHKREIAGASSIRVPSWLFLAMFLLVAWTYTIQPAAAGFNATIGPTTRYFRSVQVWYDGYWEKVRTSVYFQANIGPKLPWPLMQVF